MINWTTLKWITFVNQKTIKERKCKRQNDRKCILLTKSSYLEYIKSYIEYIKNFCKPIWKRDDHSPIREKWAIDLNKKFKKETLQWPVNRKKRFSTSLVIRKMETKDKVHSHCIPCRTAEMKTTETVTHCHGNVNWSTIWKIIWPWLPKWNMHTSYRSTLKWSPTCASGDVCQMLTVTLFMIDK